jgi:hypothetical protein
LLCAAQALASASGNSLSQSDAAQASNFEPDWVNDRCEIHSLAQLLDLK